MSLTFVKNRFVIAGGVIRWYADRAFRKHLDGSYGTGKQRGLSLAAALPVVLMVLTSVFFAAFVSGVPVPVTPRRSVPAAYGNNRGQAYAPGGSGRPLPSQRRPARRRTDFGKLNRIR